MKRSEIPPSHMRTSNTMSLVCKHFAAFDSGDINCAHSCRGQTQYPSYCGFNIGTDNLFKECVKDNKVDQKAVLRWAVSNMQNYDLAVEIVKGKIKIDNKVAI